MAVADELQDVGDLGDGSSDVDAGAATATLETIAKADGQRKWSAPPVLVLGSTSWTPHAVGRGKAVLHVALLSALPRYVVKRLHAAHAEGYKVHVAITTGALYEENWVELLVAVDAQVYVIDDFDKKARFKRRHVMAAMADLQVPVAPALRARLGDLVLRSLDVGTAQEKGRRLEALLAFLFSQVSDFRVVLRNHRNKSQEIDLTVQIDNFSGRVWLTPGKPLILVEAKNRKSKTDQPAFSILVTKIRTKRQAVRIGFLVSTSGFTADLEKESLRYSEADFCIVLIDGDALRQLLLSDDLDRDLERMVIEAMMD